MCCRQHAFVLTLEEFSNETGGTQLIKALHRHYHILPHHKSFEQAYYDHDTNDRVLTYCQCRDVYQIVRSKAANKTIESNSLSKSELGLSGNKNLCYHRVNLIVGAMANIYRGNLRKIINTPSNRTEEYTYELQSRREI
eukprot:630432_1